MAADLLPKQRGAWKTGPLAFLPQYTLPLTLSRPFNLESSAGFSNLAQ